MFDPIFGTLLLRRRTLEQAPSKRVKVPLLPRVTVTVFFEIWLTTPFPELKVAPVEQAKSLVKKFGVEVEVKPEIMLDPNPDPDPELEPEVEPEPELEPEPDPEPDPPALMLMLMSAKSWLKGCP